MRNYRCIIFYRMPVCLWMWWHHGKVHPPTFKNWCTTRSSGKMKHKKECQWAPPFLCTEGEPEPAPSPGTTWNQASWPPEPPWNPPHRKPHRNPHRNLPKAALALIWAETPKLTLLGKNTLPINAGQKTILQVATTFTTTPNRSKTWWYDGAISHDSRIGAYMWRHGAFTSSATKNVFFGRPSASFSDG